jgi:hypothetical protein
MFRFSQHDNLDGGRRDSVSGSKLFPPLQWGLKLPWCLEFGIWCSMTTRIFFAGVLGGIVMFIWTSIAHVALPLGDAGIREIPNEPAVLAAMQSSIGNSTGLYVFPGLGVGKNPTRQQKNEAMKQMGTKLANNPSGLLLYHPAGREFAMGRSLGIELVTELIEAILAVWLLAQTTIGGLAGRVGFIFVAGIVASIATNVPYWNWYGFPGVYTVSYISIQLIGFLCVGIVAALMLKKTRLPARA